jgi:hypothetical protein
MREAVRLEGLSFSGHQERQVLRHRHRGIQHGLQLGDYRQNQGASGLALAEVDLAIPDMLATKTDDIGSALNGVQQQGKGKPSLSADRMIGFERGYVMVAPGVDSIGAVLRKTDANSRVIRAQPGLDGEPNQGTERSEEVASRAGTLAKAEGRCVAVPDRLSICRRVRAGTSPVSTVVFGGFLRQGWRTQTR